MIAKRWTVLAIVGVASMLTVADFAQAQVRISVGVGPRYYGGGYYRPYYYGGYPRYVYPAPIVVAPSVVVPSSPIVVGSPDPNLGAPPVVAQSPPPTIGNNGAASIRVLLPDPNAQVLFDGAPTRQVGTERLFHTPPLSSGAPNTYRIRATWGSPTGPLVQEQVVQVAPGQNVVVDFTRTVPQSEGLPLPR